MNERDLQILAAVGDTLKEALAQRDILMAEKLKAATDRVDLALQNISLSVEKAVGDMATQLRSAVDEQVKTAVGAIQLPDFNDMLAKAVGALEMPKAPELPDINAIVQDAVAASVPKSVADSVAQIKLPQPEALPDIKALVAAEVALIELPQPEKVDLDELALKAAELVTPAQPEPLPDVAGLVADAVTSAMAKAVEELPKPDMDALVEEAARNATEIVKLSEPDFKGMVVSAVDEAVNGAVTKAVAAIELPQPAEVNLDDLAEKAAALIVVPKAPQLPDIGGMVSAAVKTAVEAIELPQPEKPDLEAVAALVKAPVVDHTAIAQEAAKLIEVPAAQEVDVAEVAKQAAALVKPAEFTEEDLEAIVQTAALKAAARVEIPSELVIKAAQEAVAAIELPKAPDFSAMLKAAMAEVELPQPTPGKDGLDALQLEVLPEIDTSKSYPRGTYASHEGGLWRTYEKSHGMRGWECVMNGVAKTEIKASDDLRTISFVNVLSDGTVTEKHFDVPVVIDRGVFKHGNTYKSGDAVTWGGSLWIAQEQTADKPGEPAAKGWRLAVKKGRDAK